jgi:3-deoxy-D-manno-octulosonic-acid transferase
LKFDAAMENVMVAPGQRMIDVHAMLRQMGLNSDTPVLIGGSTHDGEEILLAEIAQRLRAKIPDLFLILVPRHFERSNDVARQLRERGVKLAFRTEIKTDTQLKEGEINCLLVNTTGELKYFYECATVVFVGKSVTAKGGQNPIEPGAFGKPIVFGPNMQNFEDIARLFTERNGAIQVRDAAMLEKVLEDLFVDKYQRAELGRNALQVITESQGATDRTVEIILEKLKSIEVYVVPPCKGIKATVPKIL